jgi:hypothetical protein
MSCKVFTAEVNIEIAVFWEITPCSLVEGSNVSLGTASSACCYITRFNSVLYMRHSFWNFELIVCRISDILYNTPFGKLQYISRLCTWYNVIGKILNNSRVDCVGLFKNKTSLFPVRLLDLLEGTWIYCDAHSVILPVRTVVTAVKDQFRHWGRAAGFDVNGYVRCFNSLLLVSKY